MTEGFYPKAIVKNIPPGSNDPAIKPRVAALHVAVSEGDSLFGWFNGPSGGVESHFYVRRDGKIEQYRSIYWQADANYDANDFAVSIETQGMGAGEWTDAQLASIKALLVWLNSEAGIKLEECGTWNGEGVGYHSLFDQWNHAHKPCPGADRIQQFYDILVPWMANRKRPLTFLRLHHRIVSANMFTKNPAKGSLVTGPVAGIGRIVGHVSAKFNGAPDAIGLQETQFMLDKLARVGGYQLFVADSEGEAGKELAVLLADGLKCTGTEFHHAADGLPEMGGVFDHPRGIFVVKYLKRRRKCVIVNTHMGVFGEPKAVAGHVGPAAEQHAAHAQKVARVVERLRRNGYVVFVTTDANSRGRWAESLPAVLVAIGMKGVRRGIDLIAFDPKRVGERVGDFVPKEETGSDAHDAVAIKVTQRKRTAK